MGKTMTATRRRRLYRVRNAARRFVQAVGALREDDTTRWASWRSAVKTAMYARQVDATLTKILGDDFTSGGAE